jgi:cell division septal protein FtsQ
MNPWMKKNKGWTTNPLQRNSLRKAEVKKGFLLIALVTVLGCCGLVSSMLFGYRWLCRSDFFQVTAIDVQGNQEVDKKTILQLAGIEAHANLLALELEDIAPKIQGYAWIEEVTLWKEWPSHLHIKVRERRPVAIINTPNGLYYVDSKGQPFAALNGQTEIDFPVITGLEDTMTITGKTVQVNSLDKVRAALQFIGYAAKGTSALPAQNISEIHVDEAEGVVLFLADRPFPIYLGKELGKKAYNRLAKVLYWLYKKKEFQTVAYIKLDYLENKILVGTEINKKT